MKNRKPVVAGRFYAGEKQELENNLEKMFKNAKSKQAENIRAIISPHAGYVFSGEVAASSFNQIDKDKKYKNIFVIGTSHQTYLKGASIYNLGDYLTPLGEISVNIELANKLITQNSFFEYSEHAHSQEHSLEIQLPFLQYILKNDYQIVPIIIGTNNNEIIKKIAEILKPFLTEENLFVISTDFSHYPAYKEANEVDKKTANSILLNSPKEFLKQIAENKEKRIDNLQTSICGWSSVLALLYITENDPNYKYQIIEYKNSGDSVYCDNDGVVGYYSMVVGVSGDA